MHILPSSALLRSRHPSNPSPRNLIFLLAPASSQFYTAGGLRENSTNSEPNRLALLYTINRTPRLLHSHDYSTKLTTTRSGRHAMEIKTSGSATTTKKNSAKTSKELPNKCENRSLRLCGLVEESDKAVLMFRR